jgi:hypothetical protein
MAAPENESDVTNRFGNSDFILAVCTGFLRKCGRFEVIRNFRSLNHGGIPFPVDRSIAEQKRRQNSISGWRFSYSLCRSFPPSASVQKLLKSFMDVQGLKFFSIFGGQL